MYNIAKQKNLDFLFIETRTLKDNLYGVGKKVGKHEFVSTHYRRFIDPKKLKIMINKKILRFYILNKQRILQNLKVKTHAF